MKFLLTVVFLSSPFASATPINGVLSLTSAADNTSSYRCELPSGRGETIQLSVDTQQKTLAIELDGTLAHPQHVPTIIIGPYTLVHQKAPFKSPTRSYDLNARGYEFSLTFDESKATPIFTLTWTGREYICK